MAATISDKPLLPTSVEDRWHGDDARAFCYADCFSAPALILPIISIWQRCDAGIALGCAVGGMFVSCVSLVCSGNAIPMKKHPEFKKKVYCQVLWCNVGISVVAFTLSCIALGIGIAQPNCK